MEKKPAFRRCGALRGRKSSLKSDKAVAFVSGWVFVQLNQTRNHLKPLWHWTVAGPHLKPLESCRWKPLEGAVETCREKPGEPATKKDGRNQLFSNFTKVSST